MLGLPNIISELKQLRDRLNAAITALQGNSSNRTRSASRKSVNSHGPKQKGRKRRRILSAAARLRLSARMKARWAKAKKAGRRSL